MAFCKRTVNTLNFLLILPTVILLTGLFLLCLGIYEKITSPTRNYESVTGYFYDSTLYEDEWYDSVKHENHAPTYKLIYRFTINSEEYFVTSSSATAFVPALDSPSDILYNPKNPEEAVIGGPNENITVTILFGIFFSLCSLTFFFIMADTKKHKNKNNKSKKKKKSDCSPPKVDFTGIVFGTVTLLTGYGGISIISHTFSIIGIIDYFFASFTPPILIPMLLIAVGIFMIIKSIFFTKSNKR